MLTHTGIENQRLKPEIETAAYRIAQEALTNVARHSGVHQVRVNASADAESLNLQIADEGKGFDVWAALAANQSSGLAGMRERAQLLGGSLVIESAIGRGTVISALLPLE